MDTIDNGFETPELTCHVSEVESGGYRLSVKRAGITLYEMLDNDLEEIERTRAKFLNPKHLLSLTGLWADLMDDKEMEDMLDAIYAARGRDWRPTQV